MILAIIIFLVIVLLVMAVCFISSAIGLIRAKGVPFVPLSKKRLKDIGKYIKLNQNDKIVDLGCGDGRILRMFEKLGAKDLTGYEVNFWAYLSAKIKNIIFKSRAKIYFKNFKKVNLSEFNIIFCYLMPGYVNSLKEKFDKELKPGTKVISFAFEIKNWHKPEIISKMFIYKII